MCRHHTVNFTATPVNGGTPTYQWYNGAVPVGTNSATFSSNTLSNGDVISVVMTSSLTCVSGSPATSNLVTMTVNPVLPVSVSITADATTICAGTTVNFTATPVNGGTPTYQWYNGAVPVGTNSATFSSNTLSNGDVISVVMTSSLTCVSGSPATSNLVTMTVNPVLPVSVSITADATTICAGTTVNFTATPVNGGTPTYQWYNGAVPVGTNSATFSSNTLSNGDVISVVMTSSLTCVSGSPATSNLVTMTVNPVLPVSVSITADATTICAGTTVNFTATPVNGGTPTYQWYNGAVPVGTNSATFSSNTLSNGDVISVVMTSSPTCVSGSPATSNLVTMTVNPVLPVSVSITADATTICAGTTVNFTATPVNGGTPTYQWYNGAVPVGTNSATFSSNTLSNGDVISVVMTSSLTCVSGSPATSNLVTMTVNPVLPVSVSITADATTICAGTTVNFTATPVNGGTPTYQWYNGAVPVGTNSATFSSNTLSNGDVISVIMTSSLTCVSGSPATSNLVTMTVNPVLPVSVSITADATTICAGTTVNFTATPVNGGTPTYQWYNGAVPVGTNSATFSSNTLSNGDVISVVMTSSLTCVSGSPATSNLVTMTVNPVLPVSVSITADATTICAGTTVNFTATLQLTEVHRHISGIMEQFLLETNSATFSSNTLSNGDVISVVMTLSRRAYRAVLQQVILSP
ncbi:MAG: hypothetical protein IPN68_19735 [Bacteroidetes bacterium]|nr:hypothetical protein [Bacteroidota bacterium]